MHKIDVIDRKKSFAYCVQLLWSDNNANELLSMLNIIILLYNYDDALVVQACLPKNRVYFHH